MLIRAGHRQFKVQFNPIAPLPLPERDFMFLDFNHSGVSLLVTMHKKVNRDRLRVLEEIISWPDQLRLGSFILEEKH